MNDDLLKRAGRMLQTVDCRPQLLVARPAPPTRMLVAAQPPPERLILKVTCVNYREDFPLAVERHGNALRPVEAYFTSMPKAEARRYTQRIDGPWRCPICEGRARGYAIPQERRSS